VLQKLDVSIFCPATQGAKERKWQRINKDIEARECSSPSNYNLKENTLYTFLKGMFT
jgi:hypothetical protein